MLIASMLLSACSAPATPAPVETKAPDAPTEAAAPAGFNWKQFEGQKITVFLSETPMAVAIRSNLQDFTDKTGIEVEAALRGANDKFRRRFRHVELGAAARGTALRDMTFEELDALWDAAKADERRETNA